MGFPPTVAASARVEFPRASHHPPIVLSIARRESLANKPEQPSIVDVTSSSTSAWSSNKTGACFARLTQRLSTRAVCTYAALQRKTSGTCCDCEMKSRKNHPQRAARLATCILGTLALLLHGTDI